MARMLPDLSEPELALVRSSAERRFYSGCRSQLPPEWTVLFSTAWVGATPTGRRHDGEADFVILAQDLGMLVVEVKGGGVEYDPESGSWTSIDRNQTRHSIKDPFRQATAEKHQLLAILRNDPRWRRRHPARMLAGHAVILPDVDNVKAVVSPESPHEILGGRADMPKLRQWIESAMQYWAANDTEWRGLSADAISAAEAILHGRIEAKPLVSAVIAEEEQVRIRLTEQQSRVLRGLGTRRRAVVCGGAGTGKTLLAIAKARQLANAGNETVLLCYNNLLADFLKTACAGVPNLHTMTFHELCSWRVREATRRTGRHLLAEARAAYPSTRRQDEFDLHLPYALTLATESLPERFDAIVIDEGQDFREEFWLPIEWLLRDDDTSYLFVFHDQNQSLYTRSSSIPITDEPFLLTVNCRNTLQIHEAAYRYYEGEPTDASEELRGIPIQSLDAPSLNAQANAVHAEIVRLLDKERVSPEQVCVLICGEPKVDYYDAIENRPLPGGTPWAIEGVAADKGVRVDTVRRFKGLEADIVFLWGLESLPIPDEREVLYVGLSRAKSRLYVVSTEDAYSRLMAIE